MATLAVDNPAEGCTRFRYTELANGDTEERIIPAGARGAVGSFQATGSFGSGTLTLSVSNDGSTFVPAKDVDGTDVSFTTAGYVEFSTAAVYLQVSLTGGSGGDVDATVSLRS